MHLPAQVDLCEAMADIIMVEQRHLSMEARAEIHRLEDDAFHAQKEGKTGRASLVRSL